MLGVATQGPAIFFIHAPFLSARLHSSVAILCDVVKLPCVRQDEVGERAGSRHVGSDLPDALA